MGSDIRIITEPSVYLVGRQTIDEAALAAFLTDHDVATWTTDTDVGAERLVEAAGRVAYMSFARPRPGGNKAYIDHLLECGHGSVLEAAVFNLIVTGVSRSLTHELVRHRVGVGYSELSQRYVDRAGADFVVPPLIERLRSTAPEIFRRWYEACEAARDTYVWLVDALASELAGMPLECPRCADGRLNRQSGWCPSCEDYTRPGVGTEQRKAARGVARSVLPEATETRIFLTFNARAARHFIELRAHPAADAEIRRLAVAVWTVLRDAAPALFSDYKLTDLPDGSQSLSTPYRKV